MAILPIERARVTFHNWYNRHAPAVRELLDLAPYLAAKGLMRLFRDRR